MLVHTSEISVSTRTYAGAVFLLNWTECTFACPLIKIIPFLLFSLVLVLVPVPVPVPVLVLPWFTSGLHVRCNGTSTCTRRRKEFLFFLLVLALYV